MKDTIKKMTVVAGLLSCFLSSPAYAGYVHGVVIDRLAASTWDVKIYTSQDIPDTCSYFGAKFRLDASTANGKNIYGMLSMAKALGKPIEVWYSPSSAIGEDESSGCGQGQLATIDEVAIH